MVFKGQYRKKRKLRKIILLNFCKSRDKQFVYWGRAYSFRFCVSCKIYGMSPLRSWTLPQNRTPNTPLSLTWVGDCPVEWVAESQTGRPWKISRSQGISACHWHKPQRGDIIKDAHAPYQGHQGHNTIYIYAHLHGK